ncbi:hypothetical protein BC938DRAFT_474163 [Jimgerdemannia flammicorona]|uniref:BTB domain-containing protein n=1 Tax=Jimgerdemannia flammicorona TaxID=994334 RepID=A0A433Q2T0_9FUNG|nr:hypothetical protein BC938DRAFT_474163 [Jimgerdemannia flammicorona]
MERDEPQKKKQKNYHEPSTNATPDIFTTLHALTQSQQSTAALLSPLRTPQLQDLARETCVRLKSASRHEKETLFRALEAVFETTAKLSPSLREDVNGAGPSSSVRSTSDADETARYCVSVLLSELDQPSNTVRTYAAKLLCRLLEKPKDASAGSEGAQQQQQTLFPQSVVIEHFLKNDGVSKALFLLTLPLQRVRYYALRLLSSQPQRFADEFVQGQGTRALSSILSDIPKLIEDNSAPASLSTSRTDNPPAKSDTDNNVPILACTLLQHLSKSNGDILDSLDVSLLFTAWSACIDAVLHDLPVAGKDRLTVSLTVVLLKCSIRAPEPRRLLCTGKRCERCVAGAEHYMRRLATTPDPTQDPARHRQKLEQHAYMLDNLLRMLLTAAVDAQPECVARTKAHHENMLLSCANFLCAILHAPTVPADVSRIGTQELIECSTDEAAPPTDPLLSPAFRSRPPLLTVLLDLIIHCVRISSKPFVRRVASSLAVSVKTLMGLTMTEDTTTVDPAAAESGPPPRLLKLAAFLLNYQEGVAILVTLSPHLNRALWSSILPVARAGLVPTPPGEQDPTPSMWNKRLRALATLDHAARHHKMTPMRLAEAGALELVSLDIVPDLRTGPARAAWTRFARLVATFVQAVNVRAKLREERSVVAVVMRLLCVAVGGAEGMEEDETGKEKDKERETDADDRDRVLELATREDVVAACLAVVRCFKFDQQAMQLWGACPVPPRPDARRISDLDPADARAEIDADKRWAAMWHEATVEAAGEGRSAVSLVPILLRILFPGRAAAGTTNDTPAVDPRSPLIQDTIILLEDLVAYPPAQMLVLQDPTAVDELVRFMTRCADENMFDADNSDTPTPTSRAARTVLHLLIRVLTSRVTLKNAVTNDAYTRAFSPLFPIPMDPIHPRAHIAARLSAEIKAIVQHDMLRLFEFATTSDRAEYARLQEYAAAALAYGCPPEEWAHFLMPKGGVATRTLHAESMIGVLSRMLTCELEVEEGDEMEVDELEARSARESVNLEYREGLARESKKRRTAAAQAIEYMAARVALAWESQDPIVRATDPATAVEGGERLVAALASAGPGDAVTLIAEVDGTPPEAIAHPPPPIQTSRALLSAASPIFRAMFQGEYAESSQSRVVIRDVCPDDLAALVGLLEAQARDPRGSEGRVAHAEWAQYMRVVGVLQTAERFVVEGVKSECESWLLAKLDERGPEGTETALLVFETFRESVSDAVAAEERKEVPFAVLVASTLRYLARNMTIVCESKGFEKIIGAGGATLEALCDGVWGMLAKGTLAVVAAKESAGRDREGSNEKENGGEVV